MKKIFFTLLTLFLLQTYCFADSAIKFVQVTDVHFDSDSEYSIKKLENCVKDINKLKDVSFVVFNEFPCTFFVALIATSAEDTLLVVLITSDDVSIVSAI